MLKYIRGERNIGLKGELQGRIKDLNMVKESNKTKK